MGIEPRTISKADALAEAYKRGLLPPDKKAAYEEAQRRGLVGTQPAQSPASQPVAPRAAPEPTPWGDGQAFDDLSADPSGKYTPKPQYMSAGAPGYVDPLAPTPEAAAKSFEALQREKGLVPYKHPQTGETYWANDPAAQVRAESGAFQDREAAARAAAEYEAYRAGRGPILNAASDAVRGGLATADQALMDAGGRLVNKIDPKGKVSSYISEQVAPSVANTVEALVEGQGQGGRFGGAVGPVAGDLAGGITQWTATTARNPIQGATEATAVLEPTRLVMEGTNDLTDAGRQLLAGNPELARQRYMEATPKVLGGVVGVTPFGSSIVNSLTRTAQAPRLAAEAAISRAGRVADDVIPPPQAAAQAGPQPKQSMFSAVNEYSVSTADSGVFGVNLNRTQDGGAVIMHDKGTIPIAPEFAKGKSDEELLAYYFEPLGFQGAAKGSASTKAAQPSPAPVSQAPIPQAPRGAGQTGAASAGQQAAGAVPPGGPATLQGVRAAPAPIPRQQQLVDRDTIKITRRIMRSAGVKDADVMGYLPGAIERFKGLNDPRIPLAFFLKSDLPKYFPEEVANRVGTNLDVWGRARNAETGRNDTSRATINKTITDLRKTQQDFLTQSAKRNLFKGSLIGQEDQIVASLRETGRKGYEPVLDNARQVVDGRRAPTPDEAAAVEEIRGILSDPMMLGYVDDATRIRAKKDGVDLDQLMQQDPIGAAHWLQSEFRRLSDAAEDAVTGKPTRMSQAYDDLRDMVLDPLKRAAPGYEGAMNRYGHLYGAKDAVRFGKGIFTSGRSAYDTAQKVRSFKKLGRRQQTVAWKSVRDEFLNEFRGTPEDAAAKVTRMQSEGALDILEQLGPRGKRFADDIRSIAQVENPNLKAIDQGSGSPTYANQKGGSNAVDMVQSPVNQAIGAFGDKGSLPTTMLGDALLFSSGLPPVLTLGKGVTWTIDRFGNPSKKVLARATEGLYGLPKANALAPTNGPRRVGASRSPAAAALEAEEAEDMAELLRALDKAEANPKTRGGRKGQKLLNQIDAKAKQAPKPPAKTGGRKPPQSNASPTVTGALIGGGLGYVAAPEDQKGLGILAGAGLGAIGSNSLAKLGSPKPKAVKPPPGGRSGFDADGFDTSRVFYHGTGQNFSAFDRKGALGVHIGTREQAKTVADSFTEHPQYGKSGGPKPIIMPVYGRIKKSIELPDLQDWYAPDVAFYLKKMGIDVKPSDGKVITTEDVRNALLERGYDAVRYRNKWEGQRGKTSYIILDPANIRRADAATPKPPPGAGVKPPPVGAKAFAPVEGAPQIDTSSWTPTDFNAARKQLNEMMQDRRTATGQQLADLDSEITSLRQALQVDGPPPEFSDVPMASRFNAPVEGMWPKGSPEEKAIKSAIANKRWTTEPVPASKIIPTQDSVFFDYAKAAGRYAGDDRLPIMVKQGDQYFVADGHHRLMAQAGKDVVNARVIDLAPTPAGTGGKKPPTQAGFGGMPRGVIDNLKQDAAIVGATSIAASANNPDDPAALGVPAAALLIGGKYGARLGSGLKRGPKPPPIGRRAKAMEDIRVGSDKVPPGMSPEEEASFRRVWADDKPPRKPPAQSGFGGGKPPRVRGMEDGGQRVPLFRTAQGDEFSANLYVNEDGSIALHPNYPNDTMPGLADTLQKATGGKPRPDGGSWAEANLPLMGPDDLAKIGPAVLDRMAGVVRSNPGAPRYVLELGQGVDLSQARRSMRALAREKDMVYAEAKGGEEIILMDRAFYGNNRGRYRDFDVSYAEPSLPPIGAKAAPPPKPSGGGKGTPRPPPARKPAGGNRLRVAPGVEVLPRDPNAPPPPKRNKGAYEMPPSRDLEGEAIRKELKAAKIAHNADRRRHAMKDNREELWAASLAREMRASEALADHMAAKAAKVQKDASRRDRYYDAKDFVNTERGGLKVAGALIGGGLLGTAGLIAAANMGDGDKKAKSEPTMSPSNPRFYWERVVTKDKPTMQALQGALAEWGHWDAEVPLTGGYGKNTKEGVRVWREEAGLDPDGPMTRKDLARLLAGPRGYEGDGGRWGEKGKWYTGDGKLIRVPQ